MRNKAASKAPALLTSQLAALWLDSGAEEYKTEYLRRMRMCGLDDDAAEKMLDYELDILKNHPRAEMLEDDFISLPLFTLKEPFLKKPISY